MTRSLMNLPILILLSFLLLYSCKKEENSSPEPASEIQDQDLDKKPSALENALRKHLVGIPLNKQGNAAINYLGGTGLQSVTTIQNCVDEDCVVTTQQVVSPLITSNNDPDFRARPDGSRYLEKTYGRTWEVCRHALGWYNVVANDQMRVAITKHGAPPHTHYTNQIVWIKNYNSAVIPSYPPNILTWQRTAWSVYPDNWPIDIPILEPSMTFALLHEGEFHFTKISIRRPVSNYATVEVIALQP